MFGHILPSIATLGSLFKLLVYCGFNYRRYLDLTSVMVGQIFIYNTIYVYVNFDLKHVIIVHQLIAWF